VHPAHGQVFTGNKLAAGAFVLIIPALEAANPTNSRQRATVKEDGSFALSTYGDEDGTPAGEHLATVVRGADGRDDEDKLGGRYAERDALKATVKEGPNEIPAFKLM